MSEENYNFKPTDAVRSYGRLSDMWRMHNICFVPSRLARKARLPDEFALSDKSFSPLKRFAASSATTD
jgi:hypothetical protein